MAGAVNTALSYSPIVDPLRLSVAYDYFYASLGVVNHPMDYY